MVLIIILMWIESKKYFHFSHSLVGTAVMMIDHGSMPSLDDNILYFLLLILCLFVGICLLVLAKYICTTRL